MKYILKNFWQSLQYYKAWKSLQSRRQNWSIRSNVPVLLLKWLMRHNDVEAYLTGLKFDEGITCLYWRETLWNCICISQQCLQSNRKVTELLAKDHKPLCCFHVSVSGIHACACAFLTTIISCVSLHCLHNKTLFEASLMKIVNTTLFTLMLDSPLQNWRVSDVSN